MITCRFKGRLGNLLLSTYTCFWYADKAGVSRDEVIFPRRYFRRMHGLDSANEPVVDYLYHNKVLFSAIWEHFVDDGAYLKRIQAERPQTLSDLNSDNPNAFIEFPVWHLPRCERDILLFRGLFQIDRPAIRQANARYFSDAVLNVAFHVRRTDYAVHRKGVFLESKRQVQERLNQLTDRNVVCFSDDPEWCGQNLVAPKGSEWTIKSMDWGEPACNDLMLMACFDNIVSTYHSTYSYCAKLLNLNLRGIPTLEKEQPAR